LAPGDDPIIGLPKSGGIPRLIYFLKTDTKGRQVTNWPGSGRRPDSHEVMQASLPEGEIIGEEEKIADMRWI
jgi:hypothetical protein